MTDSQDTGGPAGRPTGSKRIAVLAGTACVLVLLGTAHAAEPESTTAIGAAMLPRDLSPWGMFASADIVVKIVMAGLAAASVATWTVWLAKTIEIAGAKRRLRAGLDALERSGSLAEPLPASPVSPADAFRAAAIQEIRLSADADRTDGLKERIGSRLEQIETACARRILRGTGLLATIGATAPFVGLFGTVWGIMNAFIGISRSHTTNLAVVAPGIAEALLATAFGLAAAIPAVVIYNLFSRSIAGYRTMLGDTAAAALRAASRDLDRRGAVRSIVASAAE